VRESIFDMLGSMGGVGGLHVGDLFCGSGALGIEALSRGAASAVFVDRDPRALTAARTNLVAVGLQDAVATFVQASVPEWLESPSAARLGLALCDPHYGFDRWPALLAALRADVVVIESESATPVARPDRPLEGWVVTRERRYGGTLITVAQCSEVSEAGS
jgi:16S rRNA (guanine966-N2)-methyltransferase